MILKTDTNNEGQLYCDGSYVICTVIFYSLFLLTHSRINLLILIQNFFDQKLFLLQNINEF